MRDFTLEYDGLKLHARIDFPYGVYGKIPLVIVIHGLTGSIDEAQIEGVCKAASDNGMASIMVEMYGHGQSDGEFSQHTVSKWVNELNYIIDYFSKDEAYSEIFLAGHSQGGLAAMLAAPAVADKLKALILMSPAQCIVTDARNGRFFDFDFDKDNIPLEVHFWDEFSLNGEYLLDAMNLPLEESIKDYKGKVLIVHGTEDESVPFIDSVRLEKEYDDATLVPIEGDLHCFDRHLDKMIEAVSDFFKENK